MVPQPARVSLRRTQAAPVDGEVLAPSRTTDQNGRYVGPSPARSVLDSRLSASDPHLAMSDLEDRATPDAMHSRPRAKDLVLALVCVFVDLFVSGFLIGDPVTTTFGFTVPLWLFIGLVLIAYAALVWRHRAPWSVFVGILSFCLLTSVLVLQFQPFAAAALMLYTVAKDSPPRQANPALVLVGFLCLSNGWTANELNNPSTLELLTIPLGFFAGCIVIWLLGRHERRNRLRALVAQETLRTAAQESLGEERQRIARDLHDILSHSMSAMILQSAGAKAVSSKLDSTAEAKQVTNALQAIESTGAESMRELHRLLGLLRTAEEGEPAVARLRLADIDPLLTATRHGGLAVELHREGTPLPLDPSVDLAGYHMVQESLTNAMKHAGRGAVVDIYETWEPDHLHLQVRSSVGLRPDDVTGLDAVPVPASSGTGLWGLRERVELAGGSFESGVVEGGFVTSATLPVRSGGGA